MVFVVRGGCQPVPDKFSGGVFTGRRKIAASAQMPQSAPAIVQIVLFRWLYFAITPQRMASRKCTNAAVRHNVVGSISDLIKKSPEK